MILTSKHIFDTQTKTTYAGYLQIAGNRIVGSGPLDAVPPDAHVVDYGEQMLVPGFIDAHVHFFLSVLLYNQQLTYVHGRSEKEVAMQVKGLPVTQGWKIGMGWYASEFGQDIHPTRRSLDEVCNDVPVLLIAGDAHAIWLNSRAMEELNITDASIPKGISGEAKSDAGGLTGVFLEAVAIHYLAKILEPFKQDFSEHFQTYSQHLNRMGVTTVGDVALTGEAADDLVYPELYSTVEYPSLRIRFYPAMREETEYAEHLAVQYQSETLSFGGVKQFFDGVTSTHTAFLKEEYAHPYFPGDKGGPLIATERMRLLIMRANERGWPIRIHTVGDQAIRLALEYYRESQSRQPLPEGKYNTLEHLEVMDANDLQLANQEQLVLSVQPSHLLVGWEALDAEVGPTRASQMFPFKSFLAEGAKLAFGTDSPVVVNVSPLETLYFAVARKDLAGLPSEGLMPDQIISTAEALYAHTKGAALALSRRDIGSLEPGMLADICVLDQNILECSPEALLQTEIVATYFNGRIIL